MFNRFAVACLAAVVCLCWLPNPSAAQTDHEMLVSVDWHLAGVAESRNDWGEARREYEKVIQEIETLPLHEREWYRGTAAYGIARTSARLLDTSRTRKALATALQHHFWNSWLFDHDSAIVMMCGKPWLDSISTFWSAVFKEEVPTWHPQQPFFYFPAGYDSSSHWPLIVAMHGGNACYESFARLWKQLAIEAKAVIVVPPGIQRESEITNSWGYDMDAIEGPIAQLVRDLARRGMIDEKQVYLAGFSQGAQASIELTLRHPDIFHGAISMSGFTQMNMSDSVLAVARNRGVRIYDITGAGEDAVYLAQITAAHERCLAANIPFQFVRVEGMIHEVPLDLKSQFTNAWHWIRSTNEAMRTTGQ